MMERREVKGRKKKNKNKNKKLNDLLVEKELNWHRNEGRFVGETGAELMACLYIYFYIYVVSKFIYGFVSFDLNFETVKL